MIRQIEKKIRQHNFSGELTCQQLSFDNLKSIQGRQFDYVFSNMGGLNCIEDLTKVTSNLPSLLNANATVTWVVMPPVCPVELLTALKGNFKHAFRRLKKHGVLSHLEGEYFNTYYHSLSDLKKSFGEQFKLIATEGLAAVSPQPHSAAFANKNPRLYHIARSIDKVARHAFPFDRCADHIIATFKFLG
jgi:hypothetical protein